VSDLGTALALLMIVRGWSQDELAKAAGLRSESFGAAIRVLKLSDLSYSMLVLTRGGENF
jgi:hypothetical protein